MRLPARVGIPVGMVAAQAALRVVGPWCQVPWVLRLAVQLIVCQAVDRVIVSEHLAAAGGPAVPSPLLRSPFCVRSIPAFSALAVLPLLLGASPVRAATYTVSDANWGTSATANSFAWALAQANNNLGADTISISPGLEIDVDDATEEPGGWLTTISDTLTIAGNGATLVGNPSFVSSGGTVYDKMNVDVFRPGFDFLTQQAFSFGKLAPGVSLNIHALNSDGLNGFLQLGEGSTASLSNATARNTVSYGQQVPRSVFEAKANSTLDLSEVALARINPEILGIGPAWVGAISGVNATLNMVRSSISQAALAVGSVVWSGGVANVVSSLITESGGVSVSDDTQPGVMNLVNSLVSVYAQNSSIQRLQAILGGELNITASSILQDVLYNADHSATYCSTNPYDCDGKPLTAFDGGMITLKQSYVSLINAQDGLIPVGVPSYSNAVFGLANAGVLLALDSVWLQTTPNQNAAALQSLFGNSGLLTSGIPLILEDFGGGASAYFPLPGGAYPNPGGPLIDQISNANGANQLINPIDGSPILLDVFGNRRTRHGLRTIGAVQPANVPAPLPVAGVTALLAMSRRLRRRIGSQS